ncbi:MAG: glutamate-1-semialdehyde-2,1-aminomutase [Acidobacteria bacterium]|jgi:glutamate-1-semialdehyde 2,1-aminomutase|nr:MAG: glutamate-1-semialdehyde-2,1-aminomutase [Acidobacteriota bacterium]GIU82968.1 MAG: glutamate-1-semialdehyde 2,1-aminomutase [Pyrinomonadaceae bacterium]
MKTTKTDFSKNVSNLNVETSVKLFAEAQKHLPGGVNSPVRAFKSVGGNPLYIKRAKGSKMWDVDGNEFIDYIGSWGPMIVGHAHPRVVKAIQEMAENGTSFGANSEPELELAKMIKKFVPSVEMVRMVNSGTEATMSAVRLARAFTGRNKVIKFEGCYHGHGDSFLIKAGSGVATLGLPDSPGVTEATARDTLTARFNSIESVYRLVEQNKAEIAAVFIEPIAGNMGCVPARKEFLEELRKVCTEEGILLIFDEVMTGFRVARGGAQEIYGVKPDLTTFGKIIGGGLPVGAYGGRAEIMQMIAPSGAVYQAGTLSGNPLAMTAGLETLKIIDETPDFYEQLEKKGKYLAEGIQEAVRKKGFSFTLNRVGSMLTLFFTDSEVTDFDSAKTSDTQKFAKFFRLMLEKGIYLPPSQFEAWFFSYAHSTEDFDKTIEACEESLREL